MPVYVLVHRKAYVCSVKECKSDEDVFKRFFFTRHGNDVHDMKWLETPASEMYEELLKFDGEKVYRYASPPLEKIEEYRIKNEVIILETCDQCDGELEELSYNARTKEHRCKCKGCGYEQWIEDDDDYSDMYFGVWEEVVERDEDALITIGGS